MKTKNFKAYLEKRLNKNEIAEIEKQADLEIKMLQSFQKIIADMTSEFMEKNNLGFNDLVRRLDWSPTQVAKIQKGNANLTLSSLAHLFALMGKEPKDVFKKIK